MGKSSRDHHNDGQRDRSSGKGYKAPHGFFDEMLTFGNERKKVTENNKAYRKGWKNADK